MEIQINDNKIFYGNEENPLAQLKFSIINNILFIDSIYVASHLQGQGISSDLIIAAMDYCKEKKIHFEPSYIVTKSIIE